VLTVSIHDMYGHRILDQTLQELSYEAAFNIQGVSAGTYMVEVATEGGSKKLFRLVIQ
jgi:hypothetical protein